MSLPICKVWLAAGLAVRDDCARGIGAEAQRGIRQGRHVNTDVGALRAVLIDRRTVTQENLQGATRENGGIVVGGVGSDLVDFICDGSEFGLQSGLLSVDNPRWPLPSPG